jgi:membrane protease YdiL (CAAX protease family)
MNQRQPIFKGFFAADSLWIKTVLLLFAFFVFSIAFALLSNVVISVFDITGQALQFKWMQLITNTGAFIVSSLFASYLFSDNINRFLSLKAPHVAILPIVFLAVLSAIPVINYLEELNNQVSLPEAMKDVESLLRSKEAEMAELSKMLLTSDHTYTSLLFNLLVMAIVPAIGEEFFFRGVLQKTLEQYVKNIHVAIWITAVIFSAIHFQFYGFVPRLLMGAYFGYLLIWSRSIWVPIVAHFVNNATIVFYYSFIKKRNFSFDLETVGAHGEWLWIIGSAVLFLFFTLLIYYLTRRNQEI